MKRLAPLARKIPLKSSGFKRKPVAPIGRRPAPQTSLTRGVMKRSTKKPTVALGSKYLAACRGEACYLGVLGVCVGRTTVVPCHSNQARHGKGMGIKAKHKFTVPGCQACHAWIDQGPATREAKFRQWDVAYANWEPARTAKIGLTEEAA